MEQKGEEEWGEGEGKGWGISSEKGVSPPDKCFSDLHLVLKYPSQARWEGFPKNQQHVESIPEI